MALLLFLLLVVPPLAASADRVVTTTGGPVRGVSLSPRRKVDAFLGIPYAEPPTGPLRFARPVPKAPWEGVLEADRLPPTCMQTYIGDFYFSPAEGRSEDCLHLNVWVPQEGGGDPRPVLLFIHGGGFLVGSSNTKLYDGAALSERGGVVVVTINYRVGTLGFFSAFTEDAGGNAGLYDQVAAIRWVRENARSFGGDPDNVVLFGESAGAYSVSLHTLSPLSRDLFRRAILQSGASASPMFSENNGLRQVSERIARLLGCSDDGDGGDTPRRDPKSVVDCMRALPAERFAEVDEIVRQSGMLILPRVGDAFLPEDAVDILREGRTRGPELLVGVNRDEGTWLLSLMDPERLGLFGERAEAAEYDESAARRHLKMFTDHDGDGSLGRIIDVYFDRARKDPGYSYLQAAADIIGDTLITCGTVFQADHHSRAGHPVYFYLFDYRPDSTPLADWIGVAHFDEVQYVFGNPAHRPFTEYEKEFSGDIMDMWIAFAKTGNPSIPGGVEWPRYTHPDPKYLVLGKRDQIRVRPDASRCELWRGIFRAEIDEDASNQI